MFVVEDTGSLKLGAHAVWVCCALSVPEFQPKKMFWAPATVSKPDFSLVLIHK